MFAVTIAHQPRALLSQPIRPLDDLELFPTQVFYHRAGLKLTRFFFALMPLCRLVCGVLRTRKATLRPVSPVSSLSPLFELQS
jgi:hypothetical protein